MSLTDTALEHLERHRERIKTETSQPPLEVFMTLSFRPSLDKKRPPSLYLKAYEKCYQRMLNLLINHYQRPTKKHLQPLTYAFFEYPHPVKKSPIATLNEKYPHIHSVMMIHPETRHRFVEIQPFLFTRFFVSLTTNMPTELREQLGDLPQTEARNIIDAVVREDRKTQSEHTIQSDPFLLSLDAQVIESLKAVVIYSSEYASKKTHLSFTSDSNSDLYVLLPQ
jgi:hypothetical protein